MAFLSVVTRHLRGREALLQRCAHSLALQSDPDYEHHVLTDEVGRGFDYANGLLAQAAGLIGGDYVLILDDDDVMGARDGVAALKQAAAGEPPAVVFRGQHANLGVLPSVSWRQRPQAADIGSFDFILRADVYREFVTVAGESAYAHDFAMIAAVYDAYGPAIVWLDKVICAADARRIGA